MKTRNEVGLGRGCEKCQDLLWEEGRLERGCELS